MKLKMWQVDAFAECPFEGNPAALVPLDGFLSAQRMQQIATENNLSETAFFVRTAAGQYDLRWFTPQAEVDLCGHATLASAHLIFTVLEPELAEVCFQTRSGSLTVVRGSDGWHEMSLPSDPAMPWWDESFAMELAAALGVAPPQELLRARYLMAVFADAETVAAIAEPGRIAPLLHAQGMWGLIATAAGFAGYDFVSRFFAPAKGVPEDPVTGSAHCSLSPYWSARLGKTTLHARQISPRGGDLICREAGGRTMLKGPCALYMEAEIVV